MRARGGPAASHAFVKMPTEPKIYGVFELTRLIKATLEDTIGRVWIEGELSNVRQPSSQHLYFTLKDERAQIAGVMFRGDQRGLQFRPQDGLLVQAYGEVSVYERNGQYQIIVRQMREGGTGSLQAAFEALKRRLQAEGLFDAAAKKPIPLLVQRVGIVTSPTGAAIRDILNIVSRRFPNLHITIAPVRVQGEGAAQEIAAAIDGLNARGGFDVLIVGRGGGSLEDLWCFNEESVARAIARSAIPVISAVGHETDFTISDFAADLRVPTPSAAAELVVTRKDAFEDLLRQASHRLTQALERRLLECRGRLIAAGRSYVFREPAHMIGRHRQRFRELGLRMEHQLQTHVREKQQRLDELALKLTHGALECRRTRAQRLSALAAQLRVLDPMAVLDRGYSVTWDAAGTVVRDARRLRTGARVRTRLARGTFEAEVVKSHDKADAREGTEL
ncbi:MAG: exodeoxyribonuclease VII large subunit [Kiritimatiellae bacterium]|nr:exodeoxyribonuclease VII large subunit [Kiritimatiellia bacterium]